MTIRIPIGYILLVTALLIMVYMVQSVSQYLYSDLLEASDWYFDSFQALISFGLWALVCPVLYRYYSKFALAKDSSFSQKFQVILNGVLIAGTHRALSVGLFALCLYAFNETADLSSFFGRIPGMYSFGWIESLLMYGVVMVILKGYHAYQEQQIKMFDLQREMSYGVVQDMQAPWNQNTTQVIDGQYQEIQNGPVQGFQSPPVQESQTNFAQGQQTVYAPEPQTTYTQESPQTAYTQEPQTAYVQGPQTAYVQGPQTAYAQRPQAAAAPVTENALVQTGWSQVLLNPRRGIYIDQDVVAPCFYEQFHTLVSKELTENGLTVGIISPNPGEGKTLTAANLAVSLSLGCQKRTVLVDFNMKSPSQHHVFDVALSPGLYEAFEGMMGNYLHVSATSIRGLFVLAAGGHESGNSEMIQAGWPANGHNGQRPGIGAEHMSAFFDIISVLSREFDCVVIDMPAVNTDEFPTLMSSRLERFLAVVNTTKTKQHDVAKMMTQINEQNLMGFILNQAN